MSTPVSSNGVTPKKNRKEKAQLKSSPTQPIRSTVPPSKQVHVCTMYMHCICTKSHLSPGSSCGLVTYTLRILAQRYTFFMGHTAIFLLVEIKA